MSARLGAVTSPLRPSNDTAIRSVTTPQAAAYRHKTPQNAARRAYYKHVVQNADSSRLFPAISGIYWDHACATHLFAVLALALALACFLVFSYLCCLSSVLFCSLCSNETFCLLSRRPSPHYFRLTPILRLSSSHVCFALFSASVFLQLPFPLSAGDSVSPTSSVPNETQIAATPLLNRTEAERVDMALDYGPDEALEGKR